MKKILISLIMCMFIINLASGDLGTFKQYDCVQIRVLANCSSVDLTEVTTKSTTYLINSPMTNLGGQTFNYTFCNTSELGEYIYSWDNPCIDCSSGDCGNKFNIGVEITWYIIVVILLVYAITFIGFFGRNSIITILGGMGMIGLSVYLISNQLISEWLFLSDYFPILTFGIGTTMALWASIDLITENM